MSLESYLRAAPKAELHVHLEGSIRPETLLTLAQRNGVPLPAATVDDLRRLFAYRDMDHFIELFRTCAGCLRAEADYELIAYEFGAEMARQNVRYAEATVTPSTYHLLGVPSDVYLAGLERGRERARAGFGVEIAWIFNIVRQWNDRSLVQPMADYVTGVAIEGRDSGVLALGLAGSEAGAPPELFAPWFDQARAAGLHSVPHAGEHGGPDSVWGALRALAAERIDHGVRAIEDSALVAYLAEHDIPLDVCPTSNIRLGVYPSLGEHPLRRLHEAGVAVTINSDDPALFNTTLNDEVVLLADCFGLDVAAIDEILLNGVRYSFLPPARKRTLEQAFRADMDALKAVHLTNGSSSSSIRS